MTYEMSSAETSRTKGSQGAGHYDAIVIGAGHNGLVNAAYLARGGLRVAVVERNDRVGGATRSEEVFPGYHFSVFSYLVSLLRPEVIHELDLVRHGLDIVPLESTLNPLPGNDEIYRESDPARTFWNLARHSRRDAEAYFEYKTEMTAIGRLAHRLQDLVAADVAGVDLVGEEGEGVALVLADIARFYGNVPERHLTLLYQMLTASADQVLSQWFECDAIKAALATSSIIGSWTSPRTPGSAYVLLHHYMGEVDGVYRGWGFQRGGTGEVAETLARSCRAHGAQIMLDAPVRKVLVKHSAGGSSVRGIVLEDGRELLAPIVVSSLAPQLTFSRFLDQSDAPAEVFSAARRWNSRGSSGKVNLALDDIPRFACRPEPGAHLAGGFSIAPSLDYVERAYDDAKFGSYSPAPFVDLIIPSVIDPSMAPPGKHVLSCFVQYADYELARGDWDQHRDAFGDAVMKVLVEYIPNLADCVVHKQVLTPKDIERIAGIPGGNIFHGELRLSQIFANRPAPWAADYSTPIGGYYVCGSSCHPGGGISGGPGRLAALRILDRVNGTSFSKSSAGAAVVAASGGVAR